MRILREKKVKEICEVCPRHCHVDRKKREGFCNELESIRISKVIDNFMWEEPCVTDKKGVCAIFFSGCNLKCSYCQNCQISRGKVGSLYSEEEFIDLLKEKEKNNSYFDFITPTHFSNSILNALKKYQPKIPIIWNSSGYESVEMLKKLDNFISIYLLDFKYADNNLGKKLSHVSNYFETAKDVLDFCAKKKDVFDGKYMKQGLIIRHLVLPDEIKNSLDVLEYLAQKYSDRTISLMSQFTPTPNSPIKRKLTPLEYKIVESKFLKSFQKGYLQDFDSASDDFIPDFS